MTTTTTRTAIVYVRWSTDDQSRGDSERRQIERAQEYASRNNFDLSRIIKDTGRSAFTGENIERGELGRLLEDARAGRMARGTCLLVESLDRLSRAGIQETQDILRTFAKAGVDVHVIAHNDVYKAREYTIYDHIKQGIEGERSRSESEIKKKRIADKWGVKRSAAKSQPMTAMCPAWLTLNYHCPRCDSKNVQRHAKHRFECLNCHLSGESLPRKFEFNTERAKIVRQIFKDAADHGFGNILIAKRLNRAGTAPFGKAKANRNGVPIRKQENHGWHPISVQKILTNRAVLGEFQPHIKINKKTRKPVGEVIENYFPQIIDRGLFKRVEDSRKLRLDKSTGKGRGGARGTHRSNLFTGIARCAYCMATMYYENKGRTGGYLLCNAARRDHSCSSGYSWPYPDFEKKFLSYVRDLDVPSILNEDGQQTKRAELENEQAGLVGRRADVIARQIRLLDLDTLAKEVVETRLDALQREIVAIDERLATIDGELNTPDVKEITEAKDALDAAIERLGKRNADSLKLRSTVATKLQSLISTIYVASVGAGPLAKMEHDYMVRHGLSDGQSEDLDFRPQFNRRFFVAQFLNGKRIAVAPDKDGASMLLNIEEFHARLAEVASAEKASATR